MNQNDQLDPVTDYATSFVEGLIISFAVGLALIALLIDLAARSVGQ